MEEQTTETPDERRIRYRAVMETYRECCVAEPDAEELHAGATVRKMARSLEVPYLLLWLDQHLDRQEPELLVEDIAEWIADPIAQAVMAQWIAEGFKEEPAKAKKGGA